MHQPLAKAASALLLGLVLTLSTPSSAPLSAAEVQYSEEELRAYAFANAGVRLIQGSLDRQLLEVAGNPQATQQVQFEADEQIAAAIQRAEMTAAEYEAMTADIASDAELVATLQEYVDEELGIVR